MNKKKKWIPPPIALTDLLFRLLLRHIILLCIIFLLVLRLILVLPILVLLFHKIIEREWKDGEWLIAVEKKENEIPGSTYLYPWASFLSWRPRLSLDLHFWSQRRPTCSDAKIGSFWWVNLEESTTLLHCQSVLERTRGISMMIEESQRNERRVETAILDNGGLVSSSCSSFYY